MELIAKTDNIDIRETSYFEEWMRRKKDRWCEEKIYNFVQNKINNMIDIKNNGLKRPVLIDQNNKTLDGGHREAMLRALGYKTAIVRKI